MENALERAESKGKTSGPMTDVMPACATPGAFSAHTDSRSNRCEIVGGDDHATSNFRKP